MAAAQDLFKELEDALQKFFDFIHPKLVDLKKVIVALKPLVPKITELIDKLIDILGKLRAEINKLNPGAIPELKTATDFTNAVKVILEVSRPLLADIDKPKVDDALEVVKVVSSLPSLDEVKAKLLKLIDDVVADLQQLKAA